MSAQDNLSNNQFLTLYRGIYGTKTAKDVDTSGLGMHWTPSKDVAFHFATGANYDHVKEPEDPNYGHIVEAQVDKRHIIPVGTEEWQKVAYDREILHPQENGHWEDERTVREGSPVKITAIRKVKINPEKNRIRQSRIATNLEGQA